jgi:hypothetical protein
MVEVVDLSPHTASKADQRAKSCVSPKGENVDETLAVQATPLPVELPLPSVTRLSARRFRSRQSRGVAGKQTAGASKFKSWPSEKPIGSDIETLPQLNDCLPTTVKNTFLELAISEDNSNSIRRRAASCPAELAYAERMPRQVCSRQQGTPAQHSLTKSGAPSTLPAGCVTVMVRHVPKTYSQEAFVNQLLEAGFDGCYDFVHVPLETRSKQNRGSAFVNFIDTSTAARFHEMFHGSQFSDAKDGQQLSVMPAATQGYAEAVRRFSKHVPKSGLRYGMPLFLGAAVPRQAALRRRS